MAKTQRVWWGPLFTLAAAGLIGFFTLRPAPEQVEDAARLPWTCLFPCGDQSVRDAILNVLLFIPLGLALRRWLPTRLSLLLVVLTTTGVEFSQYAWLLGRDASLRDILTNALGGGIGIWLFTAWPRLLLPTPAACRRLAGAGALGWLVIVSGSAALIRPSLPRSVYWGQWAPELGQFDTWHGELLDAQVNGQQLPAGRMANSAALRALLLRDSFMVEARIVSGLPPRRLAPIASVFDSEQREIFVLGQRRTGLVFGIRNGLRAAELGMQYVRLPDFPGHRPGDTATVAGGVVHGAWVVRATHDGETSEVRIPFSAGLLWSGILPFFHVLGAGTAVLSGLWLGGLLLPFGYYLARAGHRLGGLGAAAAGSLGTLGAVAALAGLATPATAEWVGTALGLLAGWVAGSWSLRSEARGLH